MRCGWDEALVNIEFVLFFLSSMFSMEVVGGGCYHAAQCQGRDALDFDVDDAIQVLKRAFDYEEPGFQQHQPVIVKESRRHDSIHQTGFVFEAHEHEPFGAARPLPGYNAAGNLDPDIISDPFQL